MSHLVPWVSLAVVAASLLFSVLSYVRAGRWKDGEDAGRLIDRVDRCESRLDVAENRISNCATKEDTARIEGELGAMGREISTIRNGVVRIENHLIGGRTAA